MLVLLGILLIAILMLMFVPLRYRISGAKNADLHAHAQISWFLRAVRLTADYHRKNKDGPLHLKLKVLFFTLYDNQKPADHGKEIPLPEPPKKAEHKEQDREETPVKEEQTISEPEEQAQKPPDVPEDDDGKKAAEKQKAPEKKTEKSSHPRGEDIGEKLERAQEKLERLRRKKEKVICLFDNPKNRKWLDKTLFRFKKLLLYLLPDIRRLYLHFGFEDPADTGKFLGRLSMLYPVCEDKMELVPEFDQKILEGEAEIGGAVRAYRFLVFAVPVFLNPQFFKIFKKVKCIIK